LISAGWGDRQVLHPAADGGLRDEPGPSDVVIWVHDPSDPVPSPMPDSFAFLRYYPDERDMADRDDVLSFTADLVTENLDLTGPITLNARVSAGLYCRADDRGDPVVQLAPPLICEEKHFAEMEQILRTVLTEAWRRL
jgi:hypothetical protein